MLMTSRVHRNDRYQPCYSMSVSLNIRTTNKQRWMLSYHHNHASIKNEPPNGSVPVRQYPDNKDDVQAENNPNVRRERDVIARTTSNHRSPAPYHNNIIIIIQNHPHRRTIHPSYSLSKSTNNIHIIFILPVVFT